MKLIKLYNKQHPDYFTKVSDRDYEYLNQWKWHLMINKKSKRVLRQKNTKGEVQTYVMSREIMLPEKHMDVDHISGDTLDNTRENLRVCT
ncbi:MAG TPA: hypothetical protein ENH85_07490, partial [Candidatus Scalindua sp.]|nr:hypothetical protein [Candidatus Scalindua sp.]